MSGSARTGAVAELDVGAISDWICSLAIDPCPPLCFERIGNGYSNLTFRVGDAAGRSWVLRRPPHGELLASAHDIERECGILRALEPTPVASPRVFGLCADEDVSPVPLLLMEYIEGTVVGSLADVERLSPSQRLAIGRALPAALAAVHAVDLEGAGLANLSRSRTPYAARQIKRWRGQWERSRMRALPAVDSLAERLWRAMPGQDETRLIHGDFHLLNVIVSPADATVRGVLDWELSTLGDPLGDLGTLLAYWPGAGEPAGPLTPFGAIPGFPSGAELGAIYAEASGRSVSALAFWEALGIWKVAIIAEGVMRRSHEDPRNAGVDPPSAEQIEELVVRADGVAAAAGI